MQLELEIKLKSNVAKIIYLISLKPDAINVHGEIPRFILMVIPWENSNSRQVSDSTSGFAVKKCRANSRDVIVRGTRRCVCGDEWDCRLVCGLPRFLTSDQEEWQGLVRENIAYVNIAKAVDKEVGQEN